MRRDFRPKGFYEEESSARETKSGNFEYGASVKWSFGGNAYVLHQGCLVDYG